MLTGKSILIGISGSVAAYKSIDLIKGLRREGASVTAIMTEASLRFITPLSIELASGCPVHTDPFAAPLSHIRLPAGADLTVVAPATANMIGKYASGIADDMLSTVLAAFRGPVVLAPAMNWRMYEHPVLRRNLDFLRSIGVRTIGPYKGDLACGEEGVGRMAETQDIVEEISALLTTQDMAGKRVTITAGPTREFLDPVRFISNRSSGKMGYALAGNARQRGAIVTLVTGPSDQRTPYGVELVRVESAAGMRQEVMRRIKDTDILVMAAAVADFTPAVKSPTKMAKEEFGVLRLIKTADILADAASSGKQRPFIAGFAAETGNNIERARRKLTSKKADMIVFNDVSKPGCGFDTDTNEIVILRRDGSVSLPLMSKAKAASAIFDSILEEMKVSQTKSRKRRP